jgi:sporulation protein YlmC with PRC-barrel domain
MVLDDQEVSTILGKSVRSSAGEDMGRIVDIIVSRDGQVHAAIIDFGGFLGIGMRKIAVDWHALNFAPAGKPVLITLELTRNQVRLRRNTSEANQWWWSAQWAPSACPQARLQHRRGNPVQRTDTPRYRPLQATPNRRRQTAACPEADAAP